MAGKAQGSDGFRAVVEVNVTKKMIDDLNITCTSGAIHSCDDNGKGCPKPGEQIFIASGEIIERFVDIAGGKPSLIRVNMMVKRNENEGFKDSTPWFSNKKDVSAAAQPVAKAPTRPDPKEMITVMAETKTNVAEPINNLVKRLFDQVGLTPAEIDKIDLGVMTSGQFRSSEIKAAEVEIARRVAEETRARRITAVEAITEAIGNATDVLYAGLSAIPGFADRHDSTEFGLQILEILNVEQKHTAVETEPVAAEAVAEEQTEPAHTEPAAEAAPAPEPQAPAEKPKAEVKPARVDLAPRGLGSIGDLAKIIKDDKSETTKKRVRKATKAIVAQIEKGSGDKPGNNGKSDLVGAATPFDSASAGN